MDDLTAFIGARLSEDEAMARRNIGAGLNDTETKGLLPGYPDYQTYDLLGAALYKLLRKEHEMPDHA